MNGGKRDGNGRRGTSLSPGRRLATAEHQGGAIEETAAPTAQTPPACAQAPLPSRSPPTCRSAHTFHVRTSAVLPAAKATCAVRPGCQGSRVLICGHSEFSVRSMETKGLRGAEDSEAILPS